MRLYHFAPAHLLGPIMTDGLTLGKLPIMNDDGELQSFIWPCQWLTSNGDWDKQSWATSQLIDYDRTAYRLTVAIPKAQRDNLFEAWDYCMRLPSPGHRLVEDWPGSEHWYLFLGQIPPGWIRKVEKKPERCPYSNTCNDCEAADGCAGYKTGVG